MFGNWLRGIDSDLKSLVLLVFGNWLRGIDSDLKSLVLLVAAATCWSLWLCCRANLSKQSYFLFTGYLHNFTCGFVHGLSSTHGLIAVLSQRLAQMANHSFFYLGVAI